MPTRNEIRQKQAKLKELLRRAKRLAAAESPGEQYAAHRDAMGAKSRAAAAASRDIGEIPPSAEPELVEACRLDLRLFCESFLGTIFTLAWSTAHLAAIAEMQRCILGGGNFAIAMARGRGKTSLCVAASLWALVYGHKRGLLLLGASRPLGEALARLIRIALGTQGAFERMKAAFPKICYPIARLEGIPQRRLIYHGRDIVMHWSRSEIMLPNIPGSAASSGTVYYGGLLSGIRGKMSPLPDGTIARIDLVIADDPQTDKSARSEIQSEERERTLKNTIAPMGGGPRPLTVLIPCTVIRKGDLADRLLDRRLNPEYRGQKTKMLDSMPSDMELWNRYDLIRREDLMAGGDGSAGTEFYRENRVAMDAGAVATWPEKFETHDLSAVQSAMNIFFASKRTFFAEYQNEPLEETEATSKLNPALLATKLSKLPRARVAKLCQYISAFIDVHARLLYWTVCAWTQEFGGGPIDYGTYPRQPIDYFAQDSAPIAMERVHPGNEDAWLLAGLQAAVDGLLGREFQREDGAVLRIGKLLVDAHWGQKTELVKSFCRRHPQYQSIVMPAMGYFLGASSRPFSQYKPEPGAQVGMHWRSPPAKAGDRHILVDTNWWKSFAATHLALQPGTPGGWELFGDDPVLHRLLFDHYCAEEPKAVKELEKGLLVEEWRWKPGRPDNHWWDCLVGCAVGGSMLGAAVPGMTPPPRRSEVISLAQMWGRR